MDQNTFNLVSVVIAIVTVLVTVVGLFGVYIQIRKLRENTWSNTHSKLTDQSFELLKFMSEHPGTYDYFYKRKPLEEYSNNKVIVAYIAEALANFMEHLVLQRSNLPDEQWQVWRRFIYTTFKSSVVVTMFVQSNREWYSPQLLSIADECKILY